MGDPAGVGPCITARAWERLRHTDACFFAITDLHLARREAARLGQPEPQAITAPNEAAGVFAKALPVLPLSLPALG